MIEAPLVLGGFANTTYGLDENVITVGMPLNLEWLKHGLEIRRDKRRLAEAAFEPLNDPAGCGWTLNALRVFSKPPKILIYSFKGPRGICGRVSASASETLESNSRLVSRTCFFHRYPEFECLTGLMMLHQCHPVMQSWHHDLWLTNRMDPSNRKWLGA